MVVIGLSLRSCIIIEESSVNKIGIINYFIKNVGTYIAVNVLMTLFEFLKSAIKFEGRKSINFKATEHNKAKGI